MEDFEGVESERTRRVLAEVGWVWVSSRGHANDTMRMGGNYAVVGCSAESSVVVAL